MRRLSLFLVLGLVIISLVGCGEMETVDDNAKIIDESSKQLNSLLVKSLAENASYLKEVVKNDNGNTYSIEDPQLWAEYYVSELANLISLTHQLLGDVQDEMKQDQLISYEKRWKNEFLPFLNRIKQGDIIALKNDVNDGFQLATEGIRDDNPQKVEQARDIFAKLSEQLPKMSPSKEIMMEDIKSKLLEGYVQVTAEEVKNQSGYDLIILKYLPERFQHYGIFMRDNPGIPTEKMVKQLWYDPEKFEVLMVTEMKGNSTSLEGRIIFTEDLEGPGKINDIYAWAKYICSYEFTKNGISVQGYMLVNDESNRNEYERILKSLNAESQSLEGYTYDEETGRYVNEATGIWYVVENGYRVLPPEEYFDRDKVALIDRINIAERPNDVWELKEIRKITIKSGDTLVDIINPYFMNEHFRMNYEWYAKQVLELNNITDPHFIKAGDTLKIPIYIDSGSKGNQ